jgi:hypothetical protein
MVCWLVGWCVGWLDGGLVGWMVGWLVRWSGAAFCVKVAKDMVQDGREL